MHDLVHQRLSGNCPPFDERWSLEWGEQLRYHAWLASVITSANRAVRRWTISSSSILILMVDAHKLHKGYDVIWRYGCREIVKETAYMICTGWSQTDVQYSSLVSQELYMLSPWRFLCNGTSSYAINQAYDWLCVMCFWCLGCSTWGRPPVLLPSTDDALLSPGSFPQSLWVLRWKFLLWVICTAKHLLTLKLVYHFVTRRVNASRSLCRVVVSPADFISLCMIQSSAHSLVVELTQDGRSFMYNRNRSGHSTFPWDTRM